MGSFSACDALLGEELFAGADDGAALEPVSGGAGVGFVRTGRSGGSGDEGADDPEPADELCAESELPPLLDEPDESLDPPRFRTGLSPFGS